MMKVRIKRAGRYSKFGLPHGKVGAQDLTAGDVVELPEPYAAELINKDMMEEYVEPPKPVVAKAAPKRKPRRKSADTKRHVPVVTADEALGVAKKG